jgi:hypothetical protein
MSRYLLYTGIPAVLVAALMMYRFAAPDVGQFASNQLSALLPVALTIGIAPLAVLFAFVLRVSAVAQRTVALTPFTTPAQETDITSVSLAEEEIEGEYTDGQQQAE